MWKLNNLYFRGVGIGLVIAWVTSALAYWRVPSGVSKRSALPVSTLLILLELVLSVIFLAISYLKR